MTRITAPFLSHPGTVAVMEMLAAAGYQALFVGGCVRNALLDAPVTDIDIATDARPEDVMALAEAAGLRAVPTGIAHGTVTLVAHDLPHEVTTFRRDVETDGRRATVAFARDVAEDAARRDFTMNALYARADGSVVDPLGGLPDLVARRVRFIGDPDARIAEDYLRILRFFRFHATYADPSEGIDAEGLAACSHGLDGLVHVSPERIGAEMRKLLSAPDPAPAVAAMRACGVLTHLLPGAGTGLLTVLIHVEEVADLLPDWLRRLAALGGEDVAAALRLSRAEADRLDLLRDGLDGAVPPGELGYRHGASVALDILALRAASFEREVPAADLDAARFGAAQSLPVRAADLMPALAGPALGDALRRLEAEWIASGFALGRDDLLARARDFSG